MWRPTCETNAANRSRPIARAAASASGNGAVTIKGEVKKFFVREEATYKSSVEVHITVVDSNGKTLWNGLASGDAKRFGRSYKAENYYEVLSDALVNTVSSMLQSQEIQKALSGPSAPEA